MLWHMRHTSAGPDTLRLVDWIVQRITGDTFVRWLCERREAGDSYQTIADDLSTITDGVVEVSREWIRRYANQLRIDDRSAA